MTSLPEPATGVTKLIPGIGKYVKFIHRSNTVGKSTTRRFRHAKSSPPPTTLPVDSTGDAAVNCPMDGNDSLGDCGEAMAAHADNILTYRQGQGVESVFALAALEAQYTKVSGGDNGLSEDQVVNQIWKVGIAGNAQAVIVDSLDIDVTNVPLCQFAIDQFYTVQMGWSVPDQFINTFAEGMVFSSAGVPDPANGHFTPLADVGGPSTTSSSGINLDGFYRLWTWGAWCWVSPVFVASVQPECFIVFSPRQFDPKTGLDSKGRHIVTQAALWVTCGGNPIPLAVINAFPPLAAPPVVVTPPVVTPPVVAPPVVPVVGPSPAQAAIDQYLTQLEGQYVSWPQMQSFLRQLDAKEDQILAGFAGRRSLNKAVPSIPALLAILQAAGEGLGALESILGALAPLITPAKAASKG